MYNLIKFEIQIKNIKYQDLTLQFINPLQFISQMSQREGRMYNEYFLKMNCKKLVKSEKTSELEAPAEFKRMGEGLLLLNIWSTIKKTQKPTNVLSGPLWLYLKHLFLCIDEI